MKEQPVEANRITFEEPLHSIGERLFIPSFAMRQALAWVVAAEFVRRHPNDLRVVEAHVHQYGTAVTLFGRGARGFGDGSPVAFLTLGESFHITPLGVDWEAGRFNWLDVLLTRDRRSYVVQQLERVLNLEAPTVTPRTEESTVGARLVAAFLERTALGPTRWTVLNGATVDDDDASPAGDLFGFMPEVAIDRLKYEPADHPWSLVESRYWFVCPVSNTDQAQAPVAAVDVAAGLAWASQGRVELLPLYRQLGGKIDALVSAVLPPTH